MPFILHKNTLTTYFYVLGNISKLFHHSVKRKTPSSHDKRKKERKNNISGTDESDRILAGKQEIM